MGDNITSLDDFVYDSAARFRRGGAGRDIGTNVTSRIAVLVSVSHLNSFRPFMTLFVV
jgi:hypothetical protein